MTRQEHLLIILAEECAEIAQRASKALRFGMEEVQQGQTATNWQRIIDEFADLSCMMGMLGFPKNRKEELVFTISATDKQHKVENFLEYSKSCGTLTE